MRHVLLTGFTAILVCISPSAARPDPLLDEIRSHVEGVYSLAEWHLGERVLRPPDIDGRFVLRDGVAVVVYRNWSDPTNKITTARFGKYSLEVSSFAYGYQDDTVVAETAKEAKVTHRPAEAMRSFAVTRESEGVRLRSADGKIEFRFARDGLTYSENGKVLRMWRRMTTDASTN